MLADFYELDNRRDQIEYLLRYAILAPSSRNTQPWFFKVSGDSVEVFVDYTRRLPIADPSDRELLMSVGAAITNLRVAAAHFGFDTTVLYQHRPEETLPIAVVALRETCASDASLRALFGAIAVRRTNRGDFEPRPVDDAARAAMCEFVDDYAEFVRFIVPHDRPRTADLMIAADEVLFAKDAFRDEFRYWMPEVPQSRHKRDFVDNASALLVITAMTTASRCCAPVRSSSASCCCSRAPVWTTRSSTSRSKSRTFAISCGR